ncbi:hypothetical protein FRB99_000429, partial [Tulasnella sp. 403]
MERRNTRLDTVSDLAALSSISDDIIVACLRERFLQDNIYTNLGSSALVAVNPHKYVTSNADSVLMQYCAEYRDTAEEKTYKPPHVFQLASNAYYHMRRTGQDQSILISGETGSGKSESRRLAIKLILELSVSNPGKKGSKLSAQIPSAEFVLETFGCARTLLNPNASRFGKYTELQFSDKGRLCGVKTLDYYLERNRVAGAPSGERNFHIFYYLVAGASAEERQHLRLDDKTPYRYLGQRGGRSGVPDPEDTNRFEQLKHALKTVGFSKRHVAQTCQLVAAILHLGNLDFITDRKRNQDAAVVRNVDVLNLVAEFLGVSPNALESVLSYKTKLVKKELCTVFLDPDGASDNRDDLAKNLYSLLFAWLNEHINQRLCRDDFTTFISLFDLPGPQNISSSATRSNSLDQFCINFANERLQNWIQKRMFESHVEEYTSEGISKYVPTVPYFDNSECVRLISNKPGGLIHIMDDQAQRAPKKTDHTMVEAMGKRWGSHASFKEQKRNRLRDAEIEAGMEPRTFDPYAPYNAGAPESPGGLGHGDPFGQSSQALPLVANAQPFQRGGLEVYEDEYDDHKSFRTDDYEGSRYGGRDDAASNIGSESYAPSRNMFQTSDAKKNLMEKEPLPGEVMEGEVAEEIKDTAARRRWVALCWMLTFWLPTPALTYIGRMKRMDIRQAWREKLAINIIIWFVCACATFVIVVLANLICPTQHVFNSSELAAHSTTGSFPNQLFTAVRGEVFDLTKLSDYHFARVPVVQKKTLQAYAGEDATALFPVQVNALCTGPLGTLSPYVVLNTRNVTDPNTQYHDFRITTNDYRPDWYIESMIYMRWKYRVGFVGYEPKAIKQMFTQQGRTVAVYNNLVYDLSDYVNFGASTAAPFGFSPIGGVDTTVIDPTIVNLFRSNSGQDITKAFDNLPLDSDVPCYTEDEESLRRTIDSLALLKYDDKRKLLFIICDGMIVGSGNDRPTPRIVLDILGADPNLDPEPLSFLSLGEGTKQHNMGKVYSGLYECSGHVVPYLVLVKVGKPTERSRPGNRGKRDSQMAIMHFLNKVHFNAPMNPLELEMYHQIKNVIGVNPTFYEYIFMVDADTTVEPMALNRLVSAMIHDRKVIGVCGETSLANSKQSIITMMQVYEYFISHHMAKAFESLFGSVTCLPGCFTLYRLRTTDTHKPIFISNQIIEDYSENRVDTLHMKNLLHLGEDRYLTTLLLKHFPGYKTQFIRDAHAYTVAPDEWKVLLSQRRRWINSTIHNLAELVFLDRLCGFCCFSMRFIVFIDLLSTVIQPVTVAYIAYLIYLVAGEGKTIPTLSLVMIACIYGLQALVFIMRRKWDM